jgi:hypothetical protein
MGAGKLRPYTEAATGLAKRNIKMAKAGDLTNRSTAQPQDNEITNASCLPAQAQARGATENPARQLRRRFRRFLVESSAQAGVDPCGRRFLCRTC